MWYLCMELLRLSLQIDIKFMSHSWRILWQKLGTLQFSSAFDPQMNGQTEVVNRSLWNLLRCLVRHASSLGLRLFLKSSSLITACVSVVQAEVHWRSCIGGVQTVLALVLLPNMQLVSYDAKDLVDHFENIHNHRSS